MLCILKVFPFQLPINAVECFATAEKATIASITFENERITASCTFDHWIQIDYITFLSTIIIWYIVLWWNTKNGRNSKLHSSSENETPFFSNRPTYFPSSSNVRYLCLLLSPHTHTHTHAFSTMVYFFHSFTKKWLLLLFCFFLRFIKQQWNGSNLRTLVKCLYFPQTYIESRTCSSDLLIRVISASAM